MVMLITPKNKSAGSQTANAWEGKNGYCQWMLAMLIMANQYATQQEKTLASLLKKIEQIVSFAWQALGSSQT